MTHADTIFANHVARLQVGGRAQFSECFANFLDLMLAKFCNNPGKHATELCHAVAQSSDLRQAFLDSADAFGIASEDYHDALGEVFMERITKGEHGQYFTPDHLCSLISRLTTSPDNPTLYDPACGSGRMALAAIRSAREGHTVEPVCHLNDLSDTCAKMALLNLLINTAAGKVTVGDALLDSPSSVVYHIDRLIGFNDKGGSLILSTYWHYTPETFASVNARRREWVKKCWADGFFLFNQPQGLSHEPAKPQDYPAEPVSTSKYNQLTLDLPL